MFSLSNKLLNNQNSVSILSNNTNELLGMRQQGGVFTCVSGQIENTAVITGSDLMKLSR